MVRLTAVKDQMACYVTTMCVLQNVNKLDKCDAHCPVNLLNPTDS